MLILELHCKAPHRPIGSPIMAINELTFCERLICENQFSKIECCEKYSFFSNEEHQL